DGHRPKTEAAWAGTIGARPFPAPTKWGSPVVFGTPGGGRARSPGYRPAGAFSHLAQASRAGRPARPAAAPFLAQPVAVARFGVRAGDPWPARPGGRARAVDGRRAPSRVMARCEEGVDHVDVEARRGGRGRAGARRGGVGPADAHLQPELRGG